MSSYLDLVEEYPRDAKVTQFEKVLVAARRAKDIHDHDKVELAHDQFTAPYIALQELREHIILATQAEEEEPPVVLLEDENEDGDDE